MNKKNLSRVGFDALVFCLIIVLFCSLSYVLVTGNKYGIMFFSSLVIKYALTLVVIISIFRIIYKKAKLFGLTALASLVVILTIAMFRWNEITKSNAEFINSLPEGFSSGETSNNVSYIYFEDVYFIGALALIYLISSLIVNKVMYKFKTETGDLLG